MLFFLRTNTLVITHLPAMPPPMHHPLRPFLPNVCSLRAKANDTGWGGGGGEVCKPRKGEAEGKHTIIKGAGDWRLAHLTC